MKAQATIFNHKITVEVTKVEKPATPSEQNRAWIILNNTYLAIERGTVAMNIGVKNTLYNLLTQAYATDDPMADYWMGEFEKLPNWLDY